jgi:hypothetical protein
VIYSKVEREREREGESRKKTIREGERDEEIGEGKLGGKREYWGG